MPLGSFLQGLYKKGASAAGRSAGRMYGGMSADSMGWGRAIGGDALRGAGGAMRAISRSPVGTYAATGAIGGATYGAMSSDTSVIGGALGGAALGAGALGMGRGINAYKDLRSIGRAKGRAAAGAFNLMATDARRFIGSTYSRASNGFSALRR